MSRETRIPLLIVVATTLAAALGAQDSLQLQDGRILTGPRMTSSPEKVIVHLSAGDIEVPRSMVKEVSASEVIGEEVTEADQEKIAKGLVKFEGQWMKPEQRDDRIRARAQKTQAKIADSLAHREWQNRRKLETQHFRFEYTIDPDVIEEFAVLMETYYKVFTQEWGIKKPAKMGKLPVNYYHDEDYFLQVTGMPRGVLGFFRSEGDGELHFFYDRLDVEGTIDTMFHETNHYLTYIIDPSIYYPRWINESLAEYYGASQWDSKTKKMSMGHLQEGRIAVLQDAIKKDEWQRLEALMRTSHQAFTADHYAWGWSLVHFMLGTPKYAKNFKKYYLALARDNRLEREPIGPWRGVTPDEQVAAFKRYLGIKDFDAFERDWHDYIRKLEPASANGYYRAGWLAAMYGMPLKAKMFLEKAVEMGSTNPMTYYYLALALERTNRGNKDRKERAAGYGPSLAQMQRALELDPINAEFRARYARMLNNAAEDAQKRDPEIEKQRSFAKELGDCVNGGADSYSVFLALGWEPYDPDPSRTRAR
jgi:hypothetical protein